MNTSSGGIPVGNLQDSSFSFYQSRRFRHWEQIAEQIKNTGRTGAFYHRHLEKVYKFYIAPGQKVLEIGCGTGELLNAVQPSTGVGIDFSPSMIQKAKEKYPHLKFLVADAHELCPDGTVFDYIILSDIVNDLWDVQVVLQNLAKVSHPHTRIILNVYNRLWETPLALAKAMKLARPVLYQNWLTISDIENLMGMADIQVIKTWQELLLPIQVPFLHQFLNRFLVKVPPFHHLGVTNFVLARPINLGQDQTQAPSISIVIPARNEAGNIERIFEEMPAFPCDYELVFVEGNSSDNTYEAIKEAIARHPDIPCKLFKQPGKGKGDAVRLGFEKASGDILMILDADLTVPPAYLTRFYEAIRCGKGEFINGVRLVYPMDKQAMKFFNLIGNKFFSLVFTFLLGQPIKDTLCGTKVLWRKDYERIAQNRSYFSDFDPFGDFDLLFGAAKLGLKIVDMPVRYRERTYGETNIQRWRDGMLLLRMAFFAARKIKFI